MNSSLSSDTSTLPEPRIIPNFEITREVLDHLKKTSKMHYFVAVAAIRDGRWKLREDVTA